MRHLIFQAIALTLFTFYATGSQAQQPIFVNGASINSTGAGTLLVSPNPDSLFDVIDSLPPGPFGMKAVFPASKVAGIDLTPLLPEAGAVLNFSLFGNVNSSTNISVASVFTHSPSVDSSVITFDVGNLLPIAQSFEVFSGFSLAGTASAGAGPNQVSVLGDCSLAGYYVGISGSNQVFVILEFDSPVTFAFSEGVSYTGDEVIFQCTTPYAENAIDFTSFNLEATSLNQGFAVRDLRVKYDVPVISSVSPSSAAEGEIVTIQGSHLEEAARVAFIGSVADSVPIYQRSDSLIQVIVPENSDATSLQVITMYNRVANAVFSALPSCGTPTEMFHYIDRGQYLPAVELAWSTVGNATQYQVRYRPIGGSWTTQLTASNQVEFSGLALDQDYEWQVKAVCNNSAPEAFSASAFFSTGFGDVVMVTPEVHEGLIEWFGLDTSLNLTLWDYLDTLDLDTSAIITFEKGIYHTNDYPTTASSGDCYCAQIVVQQGPAIQVEPATGQFSENHRYISEGNGRKEWGPWNKYTTDDIRHRWELGPAMHMQHERYGHRTHLDEVIEPIDTNNNVAPNFSKISFTYACLQADGDLGHCGCDKEIDLDVRYESYHGLAARPSKRNSQVKAMTDEIAFVLVREQPSNDFELLFAGQSSYKMEAGVSWNHGQFINLVEMAAIIAKIAIVGTVTTNDVDLIADALQAMIGQTFQIKTASQGGNTGIAIGNKHTIIMKPNTTVTVAMHVDGGMGTYGTGKGKHRWLAAAEIHSNYRMSAVWDPRPIANDTHCCAQSIARWDSYSLGWRAKTKQNLRSSIATHLTTYHSAQEWYQLPDISNGGVWHLDIDDEKYNRWYNTLATRDCDPGSPGMKSDGQRHAFVDNDLFPMEWYPNPSAGIFTLSSEQVELSDEDRLTVYNLQGQLIINEPLRLNHELDLSDQPRGIYMVEMTVAGMPMKSLLVVD